MSPSAQPPFLLRTLDALTIDDDDDLLTLPLYLSLKRVVQQAGLRFRVLADGPQARWDRALLFNLTFWGNGDGGGDVLVDAHIQADVVCHVALHHLAGCALHTPDERPTVAAALFGEAVASAFDVYLLGTLLRTAPNARFLETQVPLMAEVAEAAGAHDAAFEGLLADTAANPEAAFESMRALLFDATTALHACATAEAAHEALARFDDHPYGMLLHRFELSTWALHARTYGRHDATEEARVRAADTALRSADAPLRWLEENWLTPALQALASATR